jgi:hypothetical protein
MDQITTKFTHLLTTRGRIKLMCAMTNVPSKLGMQVCKPWCLLSTKGQFGQPLMGGQQF